MKARLTYDQMRVRAERPPVPTFRISLNLSRTLVDRLHEQAEYMGAGRQELIEAAVTALMREFEQIDEECGVACPDCRAATEVDEFPRGWFRVCVRCHWRWPVEAPVVAQ